MNGQAQPARKLMTRQETAAYITERWFPISVQTLNKYAREECGPPFRQVNKSGPTFYSPDDVDGWVDGLRRQKAMARR